MLQVCHCDSYVKMFLSPIRAECTKVTRLYVYLPCIREVQVSNFSPVTRSTDWGYSWFSSLPPGKFRNSNRLNFSWNTICS